MHESPEAYRRGIEPVPLMVNAKRAAVVHRVMAVLYEVSGFPMSSMVESQRLHEDLELDSLERIEAAQGLEEEFGIALSDDEVDQACMGTVGGIVDYLIDAKAVVA